MSTLSTISVTLLSVCTIITNIVFVVLWSDGISRFDLSADNYCSSSPLSLSLSLSPSS